MDTLNRITGLMSNVFLATIFAPLSRLSVISVLVVLILFPLPCRAGQAPDTALDTALAERISRAAAEVETLHSRFVQEKFLSMFAETLRSSGEFFYQRPDQLRWELLEPIGSGFVLNGATGKRWHGRIAGSESFVLQQDPAMRLIAEQLFAWARADLAWLQQQYQIVLLQEQPIRLQLTPPAEQNGGFLAYLLITFAESDHYVAAVEIHELDGDYTRINFTDVKVNSRFSENIFIDRDRD